MTARYFSRNSPQYHREHVHHLLGLLLALKKDCTCDQIGDVYPCRACRHRDHLQAWDENVLDVRLQMARKGHNMIRRWKPLADDAPYLAPDHEVRIIKPGHEYVKRRAVVAALNHATGRWRVYVLPWRKEIVLDEWDILPTGRRETWEIKPWTR